MILDVIMIINNLLRKLFTKGKSSFFVQNINNLKSSVSKNPVYRFHASFDIYPDIEYNINNNMGTFSTFLVFNVINQA